MDPPNGRSVARTVTTTLDKTQQRGHALSTLSFVTTSLCSIYLVDSIVTSLVLPYHPPCNAFPVLSSILTVDGIPTISTFHSPGNRNSLFTVAAIDSPQTELSIDSTGSVLLALLSPIPYASPHSRSWSLVLSLQFGEVRLAPCLQRWRRARKDMA